MRLNMAGRARRMNKGILFTNRELPSIHSESVPRSRPKASLYSYAEKKMKLLEKKSQHRSVRADFVYLISRSSGLPLFNTQ